MMIPAVEVVLVDGTTTTDRKGTSQRYGSSALWITGPKRIERLSADVQAPGPDEAHIRTLFTGVSRGTERLVYENRVPESEWQRMRAPLQEGAFPYPVKYGYSAVGVVEQGPVALLGRTVFCLHPHQSVFNAPLSMLHVVPDTVPPRRAVLTANMETALNVLWDAGAGPADRIVVVGGGVLGLLVAMLAARIPGADVTLVDIDPRRAELAATLGFAFTSPENAPQEADIVIHASASAKGLQTALNCAGEEARVVEMSWYGDTPVSVDLGGAFHSKRLQLISSQVGQVSPSRRPRWSYERRIKAAMTLLDDPRLDHLITHEVAFDDATHALPPLFEASASALAIVLCY